MTAQHTPGKSLEQLAKAAQMMPWDKSQADVPFDARYAFSKAITADHYLELLAALEAIAECCDEDHAARDYASRQTEIRGMARAAIQKAKKEQAGTHKEGA